MGSGWRLCAHLFNTPSRKVIKYNYQLNLTSVSGSFNFSSKIIYNILILPNVLQRLKLPTLKCRRLHGDMIVVFKMTHNIYHPDVSLKLEYNLGCSTRGNKYKLLYCTFCHDLRKYYFSARIINIWNSLPNCVVDVSTINQFQARLDKFWMHQDVLYDYTADLTGIGYRSVHVTKDV